MFTTMGGSEGWWIQAAQEACGLFYVHWILYHCIKGSESKICMAIQLCMKLNCSNLIYDFHCSFELLRHSLGLTNPALYSNKVGYTLNIPLYIKLRRTIDTDRGFIVLHRPHILMSWIVTWYQTHLLWVEMTLKSSSVHGHSVCPRRPPQIHLGFSWSLLPLD